MKKKRPAAEALTEAQIEELRGALEAEKDAIEEELATHGKESAGGWTGSSESEGEEADPTDVADNIEALVTNVPLVGEIQTRRKEITEALQRMNKGAYGTCSVCDEPIPFDRLEANPAAKTCVEHA